MECAVKKYRNFDCSTAHEGIDGKVAIFIVEVAMTYTILHKILEGLIFGG